MPNTVPFRRVAAWAVMLFLSLAGLLAISPAVRAAPLVELRVEGPTESLDPGTWYVTGTERIRRSKPNDRCVRTDGEIRVPGPTALGLPQTGSATNGELRQVRVRRDEAGLFTCEIGSIVGRSFTHPDGFAGWSYWDDYEFGSAAADQVVLETGDRILWVYSDFGMTTPANTGSPLELSGVPASTTTGSFQARVQAHEFDGDVVDVDNATIEGATTATPVGSGGLYNITVPQGFTTLRATRPAVHDVPSNRLTVCNQTEAADCPSAHGRKIVGSGRSETLPGTAGWDQISARRGKDRLDLTDGGHDQANCGRDRDKVLISPGDDDDQIAGNCERIVETT